MDSKELKQRIIDAGYKAVEELIKVAQDKIISGGDDDLSADKLKNAAATKRLAIEDAFQILNRIEAENDKLKEEDSEQDIVRKNTKLQGFAEKRSK